MKKKRVVRDKLAEERTELAEERTELAEERTMLAYFRTSFAALLLGFGLIRVFEQNWIVNMGWICISIGLVLFILGFLLPKHHHRHFNYLKN